MSIMRYRSTKNQNEESGFSERQSSSNLAISKDTDLFKYAIQNIASSKVSQPSMMKKKQKVSELQITNQRSNHNGQQYENNDYYVQKPKKMSSRTMAQQQNSLIISNQNENMQLSKLEQTKQALHERMLETQKKVDSNLNMFKADLKQMFDFMQQFSRKEDSKIKYLGQRMDKLRNQNQSHMHNIVNQINNTILSIDSKIQKNRDELLFNKQNFSNMLQQLKLNVDDKFQDLRLEFSQNKSKNVGAYSMTLKNSVHDLQLMQTNENYNQHVDTLKKQIENIKIKFRNLHDDVEQKLKNASENPSQQSEKQKIQLQHSEQLNKKITKLQKLQEANWQYFEKQIKQFKNVHFRMDILEENQQGMNQQMQRVLNLQHKKRLDALQSQLKFIQQDMPNKIQELHQKAFIEKTQKIPVLKVRKTTKFEDQKISKISGQITHKQTYFLDEDNYLLDSQGVYLLDEQKQRIKILQDQLYFLQVQGIEIKQLS